MNSNKLIDFNDDKAMLQYAAEIRAHERERCAKIAEGHPSIVPEGGTGWEHAQGWTAAGKYIADLIRKVRA